MPTPFPLLLGAALALAATDQPPPAQSDAPQPAPERCGPALPQSALHEGAVPLLHRLDREPPAAMIAAVDHRVDGCPKLVVLDRRDPEWQPPADLPPAAPHRAARH